MAQSQTTRTMLVTGATGFIGLWLVPALLRRGHRVLVAMRNVEARRAGYLDWLSKRGVEQPAIEFLEYDLQHSQSLTGHPDALSIDAVFHLAAAFNWGLDADAAHQENVEASTALLRWAAQSDRLERFVWIGGYRIACEEKGTPAELYRKLGSYEASKRIAHDALVTEAGKLGVRWTALHPATVIGDSMTGETTQYIGVAELVEQLYHRKLAALPGNRNTFVPLCHVDYLAEFAAQIVDYEEAAGQQYWLLDPNTPTLLDLLREFGRIMGVKVPRLSVPASLLKRLPSGWLPGSKETLSFLSEDRYDTGPAEAMARNMGIADLIAIRNLDKWVDQMVQARFGKELKRA